MDFADFDSKAVAERGVVLELVSPATNGIWVDADGKPFFIRLRGMDSEKMRKAIERRVNDLRRSGKQKGEFDTDEADAEKARLYAAATIEWYIPPVDGEVWECNEKNARRLYSDSRFPWVVEQIEKAVADRSGFFKKASANS